MNNKNYRVMKFFEPINKRDKSRGYVRLDIRGIKGNIIVSVENLGDVKTTSEVYLYKDKTNKIKLGDINNKKGVLKKILTFGSNNAIEDYNTCAVVKDKKIVMYSNLFNAASQDQIRKLEEDDTVFDDTAFIEEAVETEDKNATVPETAVETKKPPMEAAKSEEEIPAVKKKLPEFVKKDTPETVKKETPELVKKDKSETIKKEMPELVKKEMPEEIEEVREDMKEDNKADTFTEAEADNEAVPENDSIGRTSVSSAVNINDEAVKAEKRTDAGDKTQTQAHRFKNKFDESLYNVLRDYKQVEPLSVKINDFYWWYIPYDEKGIRNGFLPYYSQIVSSYYPYPMSNRVTTCSSLMEKYRHYIFGIYKENDDIAKFIYGIPGSFTKEEQPYKGITGFKNWSYSNRENNDRHGYWLAFVNPKTGETTEPPQIVLS